MKRICANIDISLRYGLLILVGQRTSAPTHILIIIEGALKIKGHLLPLQLVHYVGLGPVHWKQG